MSLQRSWPEFQDSERKFSLNLESKKTPDINMFGVFFKALKVTTCD